MKIYNSLSKKIEEFQPFNEKLVHIYSCGPTVYDHAHIGNLSSYIYADTLRRVLELNGYKVKHVMNYTDVDDKTIKRSLEKYPELEPKGALKKLTNECIDLFRQDIKKVGIDIDKIEFINATDSIDSMKSLITELYKNKFAYIADDGIYFSIETYRKSGKKYGQLINISGSNTSSERINNEEYDKESAHDFALWKTQKPGEPCWDFELAGQNIKGRPGWHIECSAMSKETLGIPFDIHTGGIDLMFPHHENEIAQSTGGTDKDIMARYFVHNNHLLVDGKKMSKSANNFYTLHNIIEKGYDPLAFRMLVLQSHYRKEANFTWESLESAQNRLKNIREAADLRFQIKDNLESKNVDEAYSLAALKASVSDDLDTPNALSALNEIVNIILEKPIKDLFRHPFIYTINYIDKIFGIGLMEQNDITEEQKQTIKEREQARIDKNWEESDRLRDDLKKQRLGVKDTDEGTIWYRL